ncbi:MAG: COQ9 family protein [Pseudomonadota bacterium]
MTEPVPADTTPTSKAIAPADMTLDELRPLLVRDMLPDIAFDGWGQDALELAADRIGIPLDRANLVFPGGEIDMILAWLDVADADMLAALKSEGVETMKIRDRIRRGVEIRLEQAEPHKEAVSSAVRILARPQHAGVSARRLWATADAIWRAAGDRATDYNHYTKRAILSGLYSATLMYWLQDDEPNFEATRAFLGRRIDGVMRFEKTKADVQKSFGRLGRAKSSKVLRIRIGCYGGRI